MDNKLTARFKRAWNAFFNKDPTRRPGYNYGPVSYRRPDRRFSTGGYERSILTPVINRIAMDVAAMNIYHVRLDENGRFSEIIEDELNDIFNLEANLDQTGRAFIQDVIVSLCDEGSIAMVPIDTDDDPESGGFKIYSMRVAKILDWMPGYVRVKPYNERTGKEEELIMSKMSVGVLENPFFSIMNESNSIGQRLMRKLSLLDAVDEQSSAGKLDLIIQLPYSLKTPTRQNQAEERRKKIEEQLAGSKYGVAYIDSTERVTQLNRSLENNLLSQIEYLRDMFYSQLGITQEILNGTADEKTMLNYYDRTVEPFIAVIADESKRKFLTKTARSQGQSVMYFRNPFKLVPLSELADIGDKLTRNEIASSNEMRAVIGWKPSTQPGADELRNKNIAAPTATEIQNGGGDNDTLLDETLSGLEGSIDEIIARYTGDKKEDEENG